MRSTDSSGCVSLLRTFIAGGVSDSCDSNYQNRLHNYFSHNRKISMIFLPRDLYNRTPRVYARSTLSRK